MLMSLGIPLLVPFSIWASDAPERRENFERTAEIMRKYPMARLRFIETCTTSLLEGMNDDERSEIERLNDMSAAKALAEVCGRIVRGMASGELTYDIYMRLLVSWNGEAPIPVPDYK
ncbi:UNVERIFIED_ORG: hypothetical protein LHK14_01755 [Roseateles sp. XES5]|nr:hypothetical protein [Roseateles sp. XES5]